MFHAHYEKRTKWRLGFESSKMLPLPKQLHSKVRPRSFYFFQLSLVDHFQQPSTVSLWCLLLSNADLRAISFPFTTISIALPSDPVSNMFILETVVPHSHVTRSLISVFKTYQIHFAFFRLYFPPPLLLKFWFYQHALRLGSIARWNPVSALIFDTETCTF